MYLVETVPGTWVMTARTSGSSFLWAAVAVARSPALTASTICRYGVAAMLAVTPMRPLAPMARCGSTLASSPEKYRRSVWLRTRLTSLKSPFASLIASTFGCLAMRRMVSYLIGTPVRPGMSYRMTGRSVESAIIRKWVRMPACVGLL